MLLFFPNKDQLRLDLTSKNAGIVVLLLFTAAFLVLSIGLTALGIKFPSFLGLAGEIWKLFGTTYSALFLAMNITGGTGGGHTPTPPPPAVTGQ